MYGEYRGNQTGCIAGAIIAFLAVFFSGIALLMALIRWGTGIGGCLLNIAGDYACNTTVTQTTIDFNRAVIVIALLLIVALLVSFLLPRPHQQ